MKPTHRHRPCTNILLLYLVSYPLLTPTMALDIKMCSSALGMESGAIPDSSITASSQYVPNVGPLSARLNTERQGGAWCPYGQLEKGVREYIEVALRGTMLVTGVATQGRHDRGRGQEYTKEYAVEYWRNGMLEWKPYIRWDGKQIFPGNTDTVTVIQHSLTPPVHAQRIRIVPHSIHRRTVCLRLEIYGCIDDSGIASYSVPVGSEEMGDHSDRKYDGTEQDGWLKDGLGRLTDGQVGQDFFLIDMGYARGSGWVGWRNASFPQGYMELILCLDQIRNVTQLDFYSNNYFSRKVQVFSAAVVFFSVGGKYFNGDPVVFTSEPDKVKENARNVTVVIPSGRLCKYVKSRLYFSNEWLMLSEVYMQSEIANDTNITEEVEQRSFHDLVELKMLGNDWDKNKSGSKMEIVIGSLTVVIIILFIIFIAIVVINRRNKYAEPGSSVLRNTFSMKINMKDLFVNWTPNAQNPNEPDEELHNYVPRPPMIIDEDLNQRNTHGTPKHERKHSFVSTSADALGAKTTVSLAAPVYNPSILPNILQNEFTLNELNHYEEAQFEDYPHQYPTSKYREPTAMEYYETISSTIPVKRSSFIGSTLRDRKHEFNTSFGGPSTDFKYKTQGPDSRRMNARGPREERPFGLADLNKMHRKPIGATGPRDKSKEIPASTIWNMAPSMTLPFSGLERDIVSVPLYCLKVLSNFGHCPYGEISVYETHNIETIIPDSTKIVQVRAAYFKKGENCIDYLKELRFLSSLEHPNICRVMGIVTSEMPPLSIAEYTAAGDLCQLLRTAHNLTDEPIRFPLLTFISIQICSAMKYLESRCIVHKDLATRNCLIFPGNRVKVTDTAICSDVYRDDYHTLMGEKLIPVRWLSWESILLDRYTCPSTVWSYGVTLWEILSLCQTIPYCKLALEDLIHNAEQLFYGHELKEILPRPAQCPQDLYQLMAKCWRRDDAARPTFEELYKFLVMKFKRNVPNDYPL